MYHNFLHRLERHISSIGASDRGGLLGGVEGRPANYTPINRKFYASDIGACLTSKKDYRPHNIALCAEST